MTTNGGTPLADTVMDTELRGWLESATDEVRDVIVEATLPPRRVAFRPDAGATPLPASIDAGNEPDRELMLEELSTQLRNVAGVEKTRVLKSAGAIVVRATAAQIRTIAQQPSVKAIRPNRRIS